MTLQEKIGEIINDLNTNVDKLMKDLADYGEDSALNHLARVDTGATLTSITSSHTNNTATVKAGGNAIWVEFGTGVRYGDYPHPLPDGVSPHGAYGLGKGSDPNGWWYERDGKLVHTYGMQANPFMWSALEDMKAYLNGKGIQTIAESMKVK